MSEQQHPPTEPHLAGPKTGARPAGEPVEHVFFADEPGYQGTPIELHGKLFYPREVDKAGIRQFGREQQSANREIQLLNHRQEDELKAMQRATDKAHRIATQEYEEALARGEDAVEPVKPLVELPPDREDFYEAEAERLMDKFMAAHNALLEKGIVGWNLSRPFSPEALHNLCKVDKVALCDEIGIRSTSGYQTAKNSPGRSKR